MSSVTPPSTIPPEKEEDDDFPIVAIVCVAIGVYLLIIMIVLIIRFCLQKRGVEFMCCSDISWCGELGFRCDGCLQRFGELCNCNLPTCTTCLDSICPTKEQCSQRCGMSDTCSWCSWPETCTCCDFGDLSCVCPCGDCNQCCADCEGPSAPSCDCCNCHCTVRLPECQDITCLCFECGREESG